MPNGRFSACLALPLLHSRPKSRTIDAMLHIYLFGHLRLFSNKQPLRFATLPRTAPLLAYLLLHRNTAVPRDHLAFLLWDNVLESEARANLRRHLHDLRRALPANETWLIRDTKTVQWSPNAPFWLDVAEFEQLCQNTGRLAEAITLYTGDLLPDLYEDWLLPERERLQALYFTTLSHLIKREQARGDLIQAIIYARQLLNHDPLREDVVRDLILMRHESGDRAGAIQLYQQFSQRLAEELGVAPMPETTAVYEALAQNTSPPLPPADLINAAPPRPLPPHNLPAPLTSFIGRDAEMAHICRLISAGAPGATRLLTITGPGGTGKTRLALAAAHRLYEQEPAQFPDGFYFVGLTAVASPDFVLTAVAETLGVRALSGHSLQHSLVQFLRDTQLLLLLDNFEHLLEAAPLVSDLLTAVPGLHVLVTSQTLLHLYGETEFPLSPLPLPELNQLPPAAELMHYGAINLFVERLQAVQVDFSLNEENARPVAEICARLDGMPLALELAAGRGRLFSPAAMLAQLNNRLHFLTGQARNLPSRHQTLRATIDWSYHLLAAAEQQLFIRLSLFSASFTIAAAQAVCADLPADETAVVEIISSLAEKNMVRPYSSDEMTPRFRLLQTLREYGLEKLDAAGHKQEARHRFAVYYVEQVTEADKGLRSNDQQHWVQYLRLEDANVTAALEWLYDHAQTPEYGRMVTRLVVAHERFWTLQGRFNEGRLWCDRALAYRHLLSDAEQVLLFNKAGVMAQQQGDYAAAAILHEDALVLARHAEDPTLLATTLHYLGFSAGRQGRYEEARNLLEESLALYQTIPDTLPQITTLFNNLAIVYRRLEAYDQAIAILEKALALKQQLNDQLGMPSVLSNLSQLQSFRGNFTQAWSYARQSLALRQKLQDRPGILLSVAQVAALFIEMGQDARAARLLAASLNHRRQMNTPLTSHVQAETDVEITSLRQRLGEASFAAAWAQGESMSLDEAAAYALAEEEINEI